MDLMYGDESPCPFILGVRHSFIPCTMTSTRLLGDVMVELDRWESKLREYYECGGKAIPDETEIVIAMKKLPSNTPSQVRRALRDTTGYNQFKHELYGENKYLEDYGGMRGAAHVVNESPMEREDREELEALQRDSAETASEFTVAEIPAVFGGSA